MLATRRDRLLTLAIAALLVALGYIIGFWSAEAKKETPIVFQSAEGTNDVLSADDLTALTAEAVSGEEKQEKKEEESGTQRAAGTGGALVGSVNGTKYYFPTCGEVGRIKEENRISFVSEEEAKAAGYEPSACVERGAQP